MKRFLLVFGCAAILAASVSCTKDTTVTPEIAERAIKITASVDETRTCLDGVDVLWCSGDALGLFSGTKFVNAQFTTTDDQAASATFTGEATDAEGAEAEKVFAYYPYVAGATLEGTTVSGLTIPAEQTFAESTFATTLSPMAAVSEDHTALPFRSVGAVLQFKLTGTDTFNKLVLTGNNNESIAGAYSLDFSGNVPVMTFSGDGKSITVKCAEDQTLTNEPIVVHFVVPAGVEFTKGISLKIVKNYFDEEEYDYVDKEILTRTFTTPLTTVANKLYKVTEFKVEDLSKGMDANLRAYLLKEYDANKDGLLSKAEAESVTTIYSTGFDGDVKSLSYIERLPNLEELVINSNCTELYGLTLSNNTKLTRVTLTPDNGLYARLEAKNLPALTTFELKFTDDKANSLSKIDLSGCTALAKVVITGAKALQTLDLTGSEPTIQMFWLRACPKMTTVDISKMPITTFASSEYATSGTNMFADGTMIIATTAQKEAMASSYSDGDISVTWWCVDEVRTDVATAVDPVLRAAILGDADINPAGAINTVITQDMANKVTSINVTSYTAGSASLASLAGLEVFPNLTKLSISAACQLGVVDLSAYTKLTDIAMSPSMGFESIKLPSTVVNFTSKVTNSSAVGPTTLDLSAYSNLEVVMVADNYGSSSKLTSLSCKGLSKLHTLYAGNCASVNISGCDLLQTYSKAQNNQAGFNWSAGSSQTIIVGSEAQRDALKNSYRDTWYGEGETYNTWVVE